MYVRTYAVPMHVYLYRGKASSGRAAFFAGKGFSPNKMCGFIHPPAHLSLCLSISIYIYISGNMGGQSLCTPAVVIFWGWGGPCILAAFL